MTGPVTDPPPSGPGKDLFGDYAEQLATVGSEVIEPLAEYLERVAAAAPRLTDDQYAKLIPLFARRAA
jgi:hypothetical protein